MFGNISSIFSGKKIVCLVLTGFFCLFLFFPLNTSIAATPLPDSIYFTQSTDYTCTLVSAAMMLRAAAYLRGSTSWNTITESNARKVGWKEGKGLYFSFTYVLSGEGSISVSHSDTNGLSLATVKALLDDRPEGFVLYCGHYPHAVFVTDYEGDTIYCADPARSGGRRRLDESILAGTYHSQDGILNNVTAYWYVSSNTISMDSTSPSILSTGFVSAAPNGFYIKCKARDNLALRAIQIGVWHNKMDINNAFWQSKRAVNDQEITFFIPFSAFGDQKDVTYYVNAYALDCCGNASDPVRVIDFFAENVPPTITSATITNVTPMGYDVVCTATDNIGISFIRIGTWHDNMDIDNAVWQEAVSDGNRTVIHVNVADFEYAQNVIYHTNVYACDTGGNYSEVARAGDPYIEHDLSGLVSVANVSTSGYDLIISASTYPGADGLRIGSWHDQMNIDDAVWQDCSSPNGTLHVSTAEMGSAMNTTYHTNLYIRKASGGYSTAIRIADILIENIPPVVDSAKIENVTPMGYDVVCTASDNAGIRLFRIGTWHDNMHIDNAVWQEAASDGNRTVIHVNMADFDYAQNVIYHTNVYACDTSGNYSEAVRAGDPYISQMPNLEDYDVLYLPENLTTIESEAFAGTDSQVVVIPESILQIAADAFSGAIRLQYIIIPIEADVEIPDTFINTDAIVIRCD